MNDDISFVQTLQQVYNQYRLPIWVTAFATADWNARAVPGPAFPAVLHASSREGKLTKKTARKRTEIFFVAWPFLLN